MLKCLLLFCLFSFTSLNVNSVEFGSVTGFEIPRFVSLKSNDINLRIGSSTKYPIILKYISKNLPIEIIGEYGNWRKIRDINENVGWINKNLIKGDRFAIIYSKLETGVLFHNKPKGNILGKIGNSNIVKITICLENWCKVKYEKLNGWINKNYLWGIYLDEKINVPFYQPMINFFWKINFKYIYSLFKI